MNAPTSAQRDDLRCDPTDHDYQQIQRLTTGFVAEDAGEVTAHKREERYSLERPRLYCRKCGWVRDI